LAEYRRGGWGALKAKPLFGRPPKLDGKKLQWIYDAVTQSPLQMKFGDATLPQKLIATIVALMTLPSSAVGVARTMATSRCDTHVTPQAAGRVPDSRLSDEHPAQKIRKIYAPRLGVRS
jgi:hypothetical protein